MRLLDPESPGWANNHLQEFRLMRIRNRDSAGQVLLPMSPMIDIVFLLLVFFIMTFQIVPLEGNLFVGLPQATAGPPAAALELPVRPPLLVRLTANADGSLRTIHLSDTRYDSFSELNERVRQIVVADGPEAGDSWEAIIEADHDLEYQHTIEALSALGGYRDESGQVVKLVEKIRFGQSLE
jgi:biopolymer transport protein ExbD